ncbi:uncharacterized protein LOC6583184 [Drosophila mojavensis]|uniref:Uncharacterized protein n=1 Tax=Drosophila mojavensis TaxID=7230 RepID=B4KUT0_DROMO|nr:uncharacterized protein LOC6583184 [Drosophila mojavensis]EDW19336.1 uncharacterized protein Dmoj_GI13723 [Drosophila mojavensis]
MSNQPLNTIIKQLVQCLKKINEPVSVDHLVHYSNMSVTDPKAFKEKIQMLLGIATRLGLVEEHNHHYFARSHAEDILPVLNRKRQPKKDMHLDAVRCTCPVDCDGSCAIAADDGSWLSIASGRNNGSSGHPAPSHESLVSHLSSEEVLEDIESSRHLFLDDSCCVSTSSEEQNGSNLGTKQKKSNVTK